MTATLKAPPREYLTMRDETPPDAVGIPEPDAGSALVPIAHVWAATDRALAAERELRAMTIRANAFERALRALGLIPDPRGR